MPTSELVIARAAKSRATANSKICPRHGGKGCACGMGNLFRFVEPLILLELRNQPGASGYDILARLEGHTLTGTTIDKAAVYRCLGVLEKNGMTQVEWTESVRGAGRKSYRLTAKGTDHLAEWADLLEGLAGGLRDFVKESRSASASKKAK
jgi:DNA-binding PadR family transcriptional regulator